MRKYILLIVCTLISTVAFSQDNKGFFSRLKEIFVVHDTIYIYADSVAVDTLHEQDHGDEIDEESIDEEEEEVEGEIEVTGLIPTPFDTLDTDDRFHKIILFDNGTWVAYNLDAPEIPDSLDAEYWDTEIIHIKGVKLEDLPDEIELRLMDSAHGYCIPHRGPITSGFQYRRRHAHKGVDIGLDKGDNIYAAFDGMVRIAMPTRMSGGYGNVVVIRHVNGLETYYGHLSKYLVKPGDVVRAGDVIGYGGSTGRSTGPHLHFETRYMGQAFDPERVFDFANREIRSEILVLKKHYFNVNSHYGMTDQQSAKASTKPPKGASTGSSGSVYYKVKKGDTLSKIAKKNNTTVKKLCQLNKIRETKTLQIGQRLRVR